MKHYLVAILSLLTALVVSCSSARYVSLDELLKGTSQQNVVCVISTPWDLKGKTVSLPKNSTLVLKNGGYIKNGTLVGNNTKIKNKVPFVGEAVTIKGCYIVGKRVINDVDVFLSVTHTQNEIQTLFDISGGKRIKFSKGNYQGIEKIVINNNIDADFDSSTIILKSDKNYVAECFYMEPWVNKNIDYVKIKNLTIKGKRNGVKGTEAKRCIQLFYVSEVILDNIFVDQFYGGPSEFKEDASDLLDKTRIGSSSIAIMRYDKCVINNCRTNDVSKEIFWCVPNNNPRNITYFTNNISTCSAANGSSSFFNILDGRCIVKGNEVYNYNGSAFNAFCYDSEIANNKFYNGKRSIAIDLSEGTMYRAKNVLIHDNYCYNTKGMVAAYGEEISICNNHWNNDVIQDGERIYICFIKTRGKRKKEGKYVGCDNNPDIGVGSREIVIEGNECVNKGRVKDEEIRFACLYGDNITVSQNFLRGFNVPVVQWVEGSNFTFKTNNIIDSRDGNFAELVINQGKNIEIINNSFSRVYSKKNISYTVQLLAPEGCLTYKGNRLSNNSNIDDHYPCLIEDRSRLHKTEIRNDEIR